jgi:adenylylsulfate kinase-like enzyme
MLSGPVGAGKSTVARELIPLLPEPVAYIEGDKFWSFVAHDKTRKRHENVRIILRSMTAAAVPFAKSGFTVLLDFSIPVEFLEFAQRIVKDKTIEFVIIRPSIEVCEKRAAERAEGKIENYDTFRSFYDLFDQKSHTIQDDNASASQIAAKIAEGIKAGTFRLRW